MVLRSPSNFRGQGSSPKFPAANLGSAECMVAKNITDATWGIQTEEAVSRNHKKNSIERTRTTSSSIFLVNGTTRRAMRGRRGKWRFPGSTRPQHMPSGLPRPRRTMDAMNLPHRLHLWRRCQLVLWFRKKIAFLFDEGFSQGVLF